METVSLLQSFAVDKKGRVRSVEEVARGLACDCACSVCGERLIARQGEIREWHFAHESGSDCAGSAESALHAAAKQLLAESGGMTVPEICVRTSITIPDGRTGVGEARRPELWLDFEAVDVEKSLGGIRPDLIAHMQGELLCIEIAVTHFVDEVKREILKTLGHPTVEINLARIEREKWDWELLTDVVVESGTYKTWLHIKDKERLAEQARQAAIESATSKPLPTSAEPRSGAHAPRTRFRVGGRIVDVIEHPFGLAIWSPYDPALNDQIKALIRPLGGRWQPRFKNWLVPNEAKEWLFGELMRMSGRPPEVR